MLKARDDFAEGEKQYDLILDVGGNSALSRLRRALTPHGTLVIVGGEDGGNWIGIDLFFDSSDRITMIKVGVPVDAYPEVKKVNVGRQFKGLTYQFFNHYTDGLRKRFLGDVEGKEKSSIGGASLTYVEYDYPQLGLVVHTTIDKRDHPPKPFDLEVDFVRAE